MTHKSLLKKLLVLASAAHPEASYAFLDDALYASPLTAVEQQQYLQLLALARDLQNKDSTYEALYQRLLHLYVLNGSRLDLLKTVDRRLRGLVGGQGALLLLAGDSGSGKTSLVLAFHERAQQLGAIYITGRCSEQESTSYNLWQEVARSAEAASLPIKSLPAPIGQGPAALSPPQLKQALTEWLRRCCAIRPLVILLDDLHWADADSLELLDHLTSQPAPAPILFVATYRREETHLRHSLYDYLPKLQRNRPVDFIQLEPLTPTDIERLVTANHGPCSPELVAYLHERAEGHPLFTVELLHDLIAQGLLAQNQGGRWLPPDRAVAVPTFLKQLISRRVGRLGSQVEQLLSIGAVAGELWPLKIVEPLLDMAENALLAAVESALKAGLITIEDDQAEIYRFSHGLIRRVLYSGQLARRRRRLHEQIAAQFEEQQPTNMFAIAYHYCEAEQWQKAVPYCLAAGEQATRRFATFSALQWYQQALNAAERTGQTIAPAVLFSIYDRLGRIHMALEQREEAEIVYGRLRDVSQSSGDLIAEGHALVNLAKIRMNYYQLDLAERTAYEALKISQQSSDLLLITNVHACLAGLMIIRGQLEEAAPHYNAVLEQADKLGDSVILLDTLRLSAYRAIWTGRYEEAEADAHRALQLAQKMSDPLVVVGAYQNLSQIQIERGNYPQAYHYIHTTLEAIKRSGSHHHQTPRLLNQMGYLYLELGAAQEALTWDQKAWAAVQDIYVQNVEMRRYILLNQATDYLHLGRLEEALDTLAQFEVIKEAADFARFRYYNRYQLLMAELSLAQKRFDQVIEWAQEARQLAQSNGALKNMAKSHWLEGQALAELMRFDEASEELKSGVAIADSIQHGSLRWKIRLSLAAVRRRADKSAEGVVSEARAAIEQIIQSLSGSPLQAVFLASPWLQQLDALAQNSAPAKPTYPAGLTQREIEILQLVAKGATNQQVADVLHISVRTVNTHMTNILNKTGQDNRTAVTAFAIQHKLVTT